MEYKGELRSMHELDWTWGRPCWLQPLHLHPMRVSHRRSERLSAHAALLVIDTQ